MFNKIHNFKSKFNHANCLIGDLVSLEQLLAAKEQRQQRQQQTLLKATTVISLTLVSPGAIKNNQLYEYVFQRALTVIHQLLSQQQIKIIGFTEYNSIAGQHAIWGINTNAVAIKKKLIMLEESMPIARLWDIDVITTQQILSRQDYKLPMRCCLICDANAKVCARQRKHSINDLLTRIQQIVINDEFILDVTNCVYQALISEVEFTPKPGLVDLEDNGAHSDMDITTFYQSAKALEKYFYAFTNAGIQAHKAPIADLFLHLRQIGLAAEQAMYQATNQVNTHKGAIFSFALICGTLGYLHAQQKIITINTICKLVQQLTVGITKELALDTAQTSNSYQIYRQYAYTGARGEAESGFATIRKIIFWDQDHTYPATQRNLILLIRLLAYNNDTNVLNRGGLQKLLWLQNYAKQILQQPSIYQNQKKLIAKIIELNQICIRDNLSPGGSADLFAIILFFYNYFKI